VSCVVRERSLRRADHSSRGVLPTVLRRVSSRNIKNGCSIYIYDISSLRVKLIRRERMRETTNRFKISGATTEIRTYYSLHTVGRVAQSV